MFVFNKKSITFFFLFFLAYTYSNPLISEEIPITQLFTKDRAPLTYKILIDFNSTSERCAALYTAYSFATGTRTKERERISQDFFSKAVPFNMFQAYVMEATKGTDWEVEFSMKKITDLTNFYSDLIQKDLSSTELIIKSELDACVLTQALIQPFINQMN